MTMRDFALLFKTENILNEFKSLVETPNDLSSKIKEVLSSGDKNEAKFLGMLIHAIYVEDSIIHKSWLVDKLYDEYKANVEDTDKLRAIVETAKIEKDLEEAKEEQPTAEAEQETVEEEKETVEEVVEVTEEESEESEVEEVEDVTEESVKEEPLKKEEDKFAETKKAFEEIGNTKKKERPKESDDVYPDQNRALMSQLLESMDFEFPEESTSKDATIRKFENMVNAINMYNNMPKRSQRMFHILEELKNKAGE